MTLSRLSIIAFVLAIAGEAAADRDADAKLAYERGAALYKARHYAEARTAFSSGYQLSGRAEFMFNMAECSRLGNEPTVAREQYERYLKEAPTGPLAELARKRLAALPPAVEPTATPPSEITAELPAEPAARNPGSLRTAAIALGATSLATAAVSLGVGLWGNSIYASAQAETDPTQQAQLWQEANDRRYTAEALGVFSVGCAGLAVWLYLRSEHPTTMIAPAVGPDRATVSLSGEF